LTNHQVTSFRIQRKMKVLMRKKTKSWKVLIPLSCVVYTDSNLICEGVGSEDESEDNEEDNEDNDNEENEEEDADAEEDDQDNGHFSSSSETLKSPGTQTSTTPPAHRKRKRSPPLLQPNADRCTSYDIVPVLAAPHATSVNTITATRDMRWVFTGGSDGYIRKFDHFGGMNGRVPLTVAQKHPFVDSVTKAGVLLSYWENEEPPDDVFSTPVKHSMNAPKISSVYCLAVHSEGLWMLSGLEVLPFL
jgi:transcriptional activator SPT8